MYAGGAAALALLLLASSRQEGNSADPPSAEGGRQGGTPRAERPKGGCKAGSVRDCRGRCAPLDWLGDGWCDAPTEGRELNCSRLGYDGGDCAAGRRCEDGEVFDCRGNCAPAHWVPPATPVSTPPLFPGP